MLRLIAVLIFFAGCQTVKISQPLPVPLQQPAIKNDISLLPPLPSHPEISEDISCDQFQILAMMACIYPVHNTPFPYCELRDGYALHGLIPYALCSFDADILLTQMPYAKRHFKKETVGLMQRSIQKIRNEEKKKTKPLFYAHNLKGREAWNMMQAIYIESQLTGEINDSMKKVILEQSLREPECLFFQFMKDSISNNYENSINLSLLEKSKCSYHFSFSAEAIKIEKYYVQDLIRRAVR